MRHFNVDDCVQAHMTLSIVYFAQCATDFERGVKPYLTIYPHYLCDLPIDCDRSIWRLKSGLRRSQRPAKDGLTVSRASQSGNVLRTVTAHKQMSQAIQATKPFERCSCASHSLPFMSAAVHSTDRGLQIFPVSEVERAFCLLSQPTQLRANYFS